MAGNFRTPRLRALIGTIAIAVSVLALWRLFAGLAISSFWQDEIFSMRLAEHAEFTAMFARSLTDTHPPTFYALLWAWTHLFGFAEAQARMLPALCSAGLVLALVALPRREIGMVPRLIVVMVVVTSSFWIEHAGEVRSYAMVSLLLGVAALSSSRLVPSGLERASERGWMILFLMTATLAAASHLFAIYAVAWLCLALVFARPDRWKIALAGSVGVLLAGAAYLAQVLVFHEFAASELLFAPTPAFLITHVKIGLLSGGRPAMLVMAAIAVGAALVGAIRDGALLRIEGAATRHDLALCLGPLVVTLAGVLVTMVVPSLNYRGPQVGLVLGWCGLLGVIARALHDWPRVIGGVTFALVAGTAIWIASWQGLEPLPSKQDFRSMAQHLARIPECNGGVIPVLRNVETVKSITGERSDALPYFLQQRFGYYDRQIRHDYMPFILANGRYYASLAPRELLSARIAGRDPCAVLAVVADIRTYTPDAIEAAMRTAVAENGGDPARLQVRWFPHQGGARPGQPVLQLAVFAMTRGRKVQ